MDETIPQVDGLRLIERDEGADGDDPVDWAGRGLVWRARIVGGLAGSEGARLPADLPGIGECRVRLLRMPVDEALRARAQTVAGDLLTLEDPGLVPIRSVRRGYDGIALVFGHVPSPSIGLHVLARRRLLSAGEVMTLGVALCWAPPSCPRGGHHPWPARRRGRADRTRRASVARRRQGSWACSALHGMPNPTCALERMLGSRLDRASAGAARVVEAISAGNINAAELGALLATAAPAEAIRVQESASGPGDQPARSSRRREQLPRRVRPRVLAAGAGSCSSGHSSDGRVRPVRARRAPQWVSGPSPRSPGLRGWIGSRS